MVNGLVRSGLYWSLQSALAFRMALEPCSLATGDVLLQQWEIYSDREVRPYLGGQSCLPNLLAQWLWLAAIFLAGVSVFFLFASAWVLQSRKVVLSHGTKRSESEDEPVRTHCPFHSAMYIRCPCLLLQNARFAVARRLGYESDLQQQQQQQPHHQRHRSSIMTE